MEEWKAIEGYEGMYEVSSLGRVKALEDPNRASHRSEHILSQTTNHSGYKLVSLCKNGIMKSYQVHRLVAFAFIPNKQNKEYVDHVNTIRDDNRVENLRWATLKENNNFELTLSHKSESKKGNKNPNYKKPMSDDLKMLLKARHRKVIQFDLENHFIALHNDCNDAMRVTNVTASNISRCCNGKRETAGGFVWKYL